MSWLILIISVFLLSNLLQISNDESFVENYDLLVNNAVLEIKNYHLNYLIVVKNGSQ